MALSAILNHPVTTWSRRLTALVAGATAAVTLLAGCSALLDLRQEAINQKPFARRAEKFDFTVVNAIASQGILLAPATVNAWSSTLHIGWTPLEVGPNWCKEQSYMIKKPGPSVFTHMPNDWYLCGRAPSKRYSLPSSMTSGYWLYPLQVLFIGVILALIGWKLWPRKRWSEARLAQARGLSAVVTASPHATTASDSDISLCRPWLFSAARKIPTPEGPAG